MEKTLFYELAVKDISRCLVIVDSNLGEYYQSLLLKGERIDEKELRKKEFIVEGLNPPDLLFYLSIFLVSPKLCKTLEEMEVKGFQLIPGNVVHRSGVAIPGYNIVNLLHILPAWDYEHTEWMTVERENAHYPTLNYWEIALKADVVQGYDIFRLVEPRFSIYISEFLRNILMNVGCNNCNFIPIKSF